MVHTLVLGQFRLGDLNGGLAAGGYRFSVLPHEVHISCDLRGKCSVSALYSVVIEDTYTFGQLFEWNSEKWGNSVWRAPPMELVRERF